MKATDRLPPTPPAGAPIRPRPPLLSARRLETLHGYALISPWLIGIVVFLLGPIVASLYLSFCRWNLLQDPVWVGLKNYTTILSGEDKIVKSLAVTIYYTVLAVPLNVVLSILVAVLLNQRLRGMGVFRTVFYLPAVTSGVAVAVLWAWIFSKDYGLLNWALGWVGVPAYGWLSDERLVVPAFVFMALWGIGGNMVIYLAGLQNIPRELYEAAELDGAGATRRFFHVTLPLLTPVIFFNMIMAVIGSFQIFTQAFIMTKGGPNDASMFYMLYLFNNAFRYFKMGYASAMAWILFLIILVLTLIQFAIARKWVYYEYKEPQ